MMIAPPSSTGRWSTFIDLSQPDSATTTTKMGSMQETFVGSIDQGTTSSRFLIFNKDGEPVASHQIEFTQIYPSSG